MTDAAPDFMFVVVPREDVFSGDLGETLGVLRYLATATEALTTYRERVDIRFDGFDEDPRELWEIPEVRSFVERLDEQFPFWLYFMSRHGTGLIAILRCFLLPRLTPQADARVNNPKLADLLMRRWLPALNHMAARAGMTEAELLRLSDSAMDYLAKGPTR